MPSLSSASPLRAPSALVLLALAGCSACTGDPSGPGGGPDGPTGRIFFEWIPDGAPGPQPWVYDFAAGEASRVPIWFNEASSSSVDTAGSAIALDPPGTDLVVVSLVDTSLIEVWPKLHPAITRPALSPDAALLAWVRPVGGQDEAIDLLDRTTGRVALLGVFERRSNVRVVHWFAGGDSVLVAGTIGSGARVYDVAQVDDTRSGMFGFTPAYGALAVAISRDERWIALGGVRPGGVFDEAAVRRIEIWDLSQRALRRTIDLPHGVAFLAWSPDGRYLAHAPAQSAEKRSVLEVLDRITGERQLLIPGEGFDLGARNLTWIH